MVFKGLLLMMVPGSGRGYKPEISTLIGRGVGVRVGTTNLATEKGSTHLLAYWTGAAYQGSGPR